MKFEISDALADNAKGLINHLTLESMKANYPEFMRVYEDAARADKGMENIYGKVHPGAKRYYQEAGMGLPEGS